MPPLDADTTDLRLRVAVALAGVHPEQLWWDCLALVGAETITPAEVITAVHGAPCRPAFVTTVGIAVNERLLDVGLAPLIDPPRGLNE